MCAIVLLNRTQGLAVIHPCVEPSQLSHLASSDSRNFCSDLDAALITSIALRWVVAACP